MHWPRDQKVKSQGHKVTKTVTVARLLVTMSRIPHTCTPLCYLRPLPAWVCMSIRLSMFSRVPGSLRYMAAFWSLSLFHSIPVCDRQTDIRNCYNSIALCTVVLCWRAVKNYNCRDGVQSWSPRRPSIRSVWTRSCVVSTSSSLDSVERCQPPQLMRRVKAASSSSTDYTDWDQHTHTHTATSVTAVSKIQACFEAQNAS